ncbi:MAG: gliding motility-associated C-terminal domain-containing protein [Saprospiraceae bacterium]|nr:gliding motility-associated C-terminal domain-containing protein [Saprospiraceae bacterium]
MKNILLVTLSLFLINFTYGQAPSNNECSAEVDLGVVPNCGQTVYTNVDATASDIGVGNNPTCFNGGTTQNDVWFTFTTTDEIRDVTIRVTGTDAGANSALQNPQIAVYRGTCLVNGLQEIACLSSNDGASSLELDLFDLSANVTFFLRINDFSATGTPNWGDFTVCVEEFVADFNIGDAPSTTACTGTLYDSGGPDGAYGINENSTFTICPDDPHSCLQIDVVELATETLFGAGIDFLRVYAGTSTDAPLVANLFGVVNNLPVYVESDCATIQFQSDLSVNLDGFMLTWTCTPNACGGSTSGNPTEIASIPFSDSFDTCEGGASIGQTACEGASFVQGPDYVFRYDSPGNLCARIELSNAAPGTGVLVLDGPPNDPNSSCVGVGAAGVIGSVDLKDPRSYYIVVANASGCTTFDINITETDCALSPALTNALCNPLNGCLREDGLPVVLQFQQGFQDIAFNEGQNDGCWLNIGSNQPNYYWFSIEAQEAGDFGFIIEAANPSEASDIDFNVWGPFTNEQVCLSPNEVINFIETNQPVRSSWAAGVEPTGLANVNADGQPVTDEYDCGAEPGAGGDDFVRPIQAQPGEIYLVLVNDWGNDIQSGEISIDWGPSDAAVLDPIIPEVTAGDTVVCQGSSVQIQIEEVVDNITWISGTESLSCNNCFDPIATPDETTTYQAEIQGVCFTDTISVEVVVYAVDAGPNATVCRGEEFQIVAGLDFDIGDYTWSAQDGVTLSCTDCPDPMVSADAAGDYTVTVTLVTPSCTLTDDMTLTVLDSEAPQYNIADDLTLCEGESLDLGGAPVDGTSYVWTSRPGGFNSTEANPSATPTESTTYLLSVTNADCPVPSLDSVVVDFLALPVLSVLPDTTVCQDDELVLGATMIEADVSYQWSGPGTIADDALANTSAIITSSGTYSLTASRDICSTTASFEVTMTEISIDILGADSLAVCRGEEVALEVEATPADSTVTWFPTAGLSAAEGRSITATPDFPTTYYATVNAPNGCVRTDSIFIEVDSLPVNLDIMPSDTSICEGSLLVLTSEIFEPSDFEDIEFQWGGGSGFISGDSLYNMVLNPDTTSRYFRVATLGVCVDTSFADVEVKPIPQIRIMPMDTTVCAGSPVQITTTYDPGIDEVMWMPMEGLSCTDCEDPIAIAVQTTTYTVQGDLNDCPGSASMTINVDPLPLIQLVPDQVICVGSTETIRLNEAPAEADATYLWVSPDNPGFSSTDPGLAVSPEETTTYELTATNDCGPVTQQVTIFVVQDATVSLDGPTEVCRGDDITFNAMGTAPANVQQVFEWLVNGQPTDQTGPSFNLTNLQSSVTVSVNYTYGPNCGTATASADVQVFDAPEITFVPIPDTIFNGETVTLTAQILPAIDGLTYQWEGEGVQEPSDGASVIVRPFINGEEPEQETFFYTLTVTTPTGCTATATIGVFVFNPTPMIPNVFTPNGDEVNDEFKAFFPGTAIQVVTFKVFNRWGQIVHNVSDNTPWEGEHNGKPAPSDVYVYQIIYELPGGLRKEEKGDVTLAR